MMIPHSRFLLPTGVNKWDLPAKGDLHARQERPPAALAAKPGMADQEGITHDCILTL